MFGFIARADDSDAEPVVGAGTVERVVLDQERFLARVDAAGVRRPVPAQTPGRGPRVGVLAGR